MDIRNGDLQINLQASIYLITNLSIYYLIKYFRSLKINITVICFRERDHLNK